MKRMRSLLFAVFAIAFPIIVLTSSFGCACGGNDSVTITYNTGGGVILSNSDVVPAGNSVVLPLPTYDGYTFNGWYTNGGARAGYAGASYIASASVTLYAQWSPNVSVGYSEQYSYEPGYSQYYVDYEIHYYVNDFHWDTQVASAYFDSYAAAWAFSLTGGPNPIPYDEQVWINGVNRWWASYERDNYKIVIEDMAGEGEYPYYGGLFPGTDEAPDFWALSVGEYTTRILGSQGTATYVVTELEEDPGYFDLDEAIRVHEWWWITTYSGWVRGEPDIYTIRIVPNTTIFSCR